jgi:hypothetical protein
MLRVATEVIVEFASVSEGSTICCLIQLGNVQCGTNPLNGGVSGH